MNTQSPLLAASTPTYNITALTELLNDYHKNGLPEEAYIMEKLLSVALCHDESEARKLAKKVIKKQGNDAVKTALKLKSRRNYIQDTGNKNIKEDLKEFESIEGLHTHQFARFLYHKNGTGLRCLRNAFYYFEENASEEEIKDFFRNDFYDEKDKERIYFQKLQYVTIYIHTAQHLANILPELKDQLYSLYIRAVYEPKEPSNCFDLSMIDFRQFPNLYKLNVHGNMAALPESLFEAPKLRDLEVKNTAIEQLPNNITAASNLQKMILGKLSLTSLPEDIGKTNLKELYLWDLPNLKTLPASLEKAQLKYIQVENVKFSSLPTGVSERYNLSKYLDTADPYLTIYDQLGMFVNYYAHVPLIKAYMEDYHQNKNGLQAKVGELVLAVSKCYKDEEHGPSSQNAYAQWIADYAPKPVLEASEQLKGHFYIDSNSNLDNIKEKLAGIKDFDADAFVKIAAAMIENKPKYI